MALADDRLSKPVTGRYFPASFPEVLAAVETHCFSVHNYHKRLPILMENCVARSDRGHQLCSFKRMSYIAVFSLPEEVPRALSRRAMEVAAQQFAEIDCAAWPAMRDQQFVVYRAFLGAVGALSITQHVINGGFRSYLQFRRASQLSKSSSSTKGQKELFSVQVV